MTAGGRGHRKTKMALRSVTDSTWVQDLHPVHGHMQASGGNQWAQRCQCWEQAGKRQHCRMAQPAPSSSTARWSAAYLRGPPRKGTACASLPGLSKGYPARRTDRSGVAAGVCPYLQTTEVRAPGPGLPSGYGAGQWLGASVFLEALEQEVVNGSKVVIAAVLQRLGRKKRGRVTQRPSPRLRLPGEGHSQVMT